MKDLLIEGHTLLIELTYDKSTQLFHVDLFDADGTFPLSEGTSGETIKDALFEMVEIMEESEHK